MIFLFTGALFLNFTYNNTRSYSLFQCLLSSTMIAKTLNSSSQSSLFFIITNHKIPAHVGVCLIVDFASLRICVAWP